MVGILSDVGNVREINEDSVGYYKVKDRSIYVIADGMGGHSAGEVASKVAVDFTIDYIKGLNNITDLKREITIAVQKSNEEIFNLSRCRKNLSGMGTTITACLISEGKAIVANVGDSSCYIIDKNDKIKKITKDHSLVQQLVDNGTITEEQAKKHPNKNIITRALGTNKQIEVDVFDLNLKEIKNIILCTDGLTNDVAPEEICEIVLNHTQEDSCRLLIEYSKQRGGRDNISVIVFEGECKDGRNFTRE